MSCTSWRHGLTLVARLLDHVRSQGSLRIQAMPTVSSRPIERLDIPHKFIGPAAIQPLSFDANLPVSKPSHSGSITYEDFQRIRCMLKLQSRKIAFPFHSRVASCLHLDPRAQVPASKYLHLRNAHRWADSGQLPSLKSLVLKSVILDRVSWACFGVETNSLWASWQIQNRSNIL